MSNEKNNLIPGKLYTIKSDNKENWYCVDNKLFVLLKPPPHKNYKLCNNFMFIKQIQNKSIEGYCEYYFLFENKLIKKTMSDKSLFWGTWKLNE